MAEYSFTMKRYNAQSKDFEIMYPRTKYEQVDGDLQRQITTIALTLKSTSWLLGDGYSYQTVTIPSGGVNTKVDLQADYETLGNMMMGGTTSVFVENADGAFTAYAVGEIPVVDMTFQATLTNAEST